MTELELLRQEMEEMKKKMAALEAETQRIDDYRGICNAMMGHMYSYYSHSEQKDLETYWVQSRDDIAYAHNSRTYFGQDGVREYYVDGTNKSKENYRRFAKNVYNMDWPEGTAPGYRVMNILGTPYVEIAKDRKTAQGIWMAFSFMSNMNSKGRANPSYVLQRFSGDFLNENGQWKLWHIRDYTDVGMDIGTFITELEDVQWDENHRPIERKGPPIGKQDQPDDPDDLPPMQVEDGEKIRRLDVQSADTYEPWTITYNEPAIPTPYEKWDPSRCYITIAEQHRDENSRFEVD